MRYVLPGFVDVHVHFRDPGVREAETTVTGLSAAARGGFAAVVTMPNTTPACDAPALLRYQCEAARAPDPRFPNLPRPRLVPSACLTKGRLGKEVADLRALAAAGAAFFTDDGTYVADPHVLESAMRLAKELDRVVCQHALAPDVTEGAAIARDLSVCRVTGCRYHIQHISTAAGVALVRAAQKEGLPVTAEATPHHLLLTRDDIPADDSFASPASLYKMAPPLATKEDRAEVRRAVKEGALMFATDHAPHPPSKKCVPYAKAANGITGLETALAVTYGVMVEEEGMSVDAWARAWHEMPLSIVAGSSDWEASLAPTVVETGAPRALDLTHAASLSRNCPYAGMRFACWPVTEENA